MVADVCRKLRLWYIMARGVDQKKKKRSTHWTGFLVAHAGLKLTS